MRFSNESSNQLNHFNMSIIHVLSNSDFVPPDQAMKLLESMSSEKLEKDINSEDALGWTPLMVACQMQSDLNFIIFLLSKGADLQYQSASGTPMIAAIDGGKVDTVKYLIEKKGYDVNRTDL